MEIERDASAASLPVECEPDRPQSWTEIEPGRYQPKRTRGSNPGRELG
jgi:hypothetical protein